MSGFAAERAIELEFVNVGQKVAHVRHVPSDVKFRARIEVSFAARNRWRYSLIFQPQVPPCLVVIIRPDFSRENLPAPFVDEQSEGKKCDFIESLAKQNWNIGLREWDFIEQANLLQIFGRDG